MGCAVHAGVRAYAAAIAEVEAAAQDVPLPVLSGQMQSKARAVLQHDPQAAAAAAAPAAAAPAAAATALAASAAAAAAIVEVWSMVF